MIPEPAPASGLDLLERCLLVQEVLSRTSDKWSVLVVMMLAEGPKRFNEMKHAITVISQRMLTLTLRGLERDGLVSRTVTATVPQRVDYELTPLGQSLRGPIEALGDWAIAHKERVRQARGAYDEAAVQEKMTMPLS